MTDNSIPPVPDRLAKWRSEGETVELMGRQIVAIPAAHWEEFELWAKRPPQALPAVNELFSRKAAWGQ